MDAEASSIRTIVAALVGNIAIAVAKYVAAAVTGSSAMLSEAIHSTVDTGNELLLLYGLRRAKRPADPEHPFGHGLQLYFWTFVVAVMIFGLGAVVSLIEGVHKLSDPHPVAHVYVNYVVLGVSMVFEMGSWTVAFREFRRAQGERNWLQAARRSKDPTVFTVLFEDTAALLGLVAAFSGVALADVLDFPVFDGIASLAIAVILLITAAFLAYESQSLLTGEAAQPETRSAIARVAAQTPGVVGINEILTMHFGPRDLLVALSLDFDDTIPAGRVEVAVAQLELQLKTEFPEVARVFIEAKAFRDHARGTRSDAPLDGTAIVPSTESSERRSLHKAGLPEK